MEIWTKNLKKKGMSVCFLHHVPLPSSKLHSLVFKWHQTADYTVGISIWDDSQLHGEWETGSRSLSPPPQKFIITSPSGQSMFSPWCLESLPHALIIGSAVSQRWGIQMKVAMIWMTGWCLVFTGSGTRGEIMKRGDWGETPTAPLLKWPTQTKSRSLWTAAQNAWLWAEF